MITFKKLMRGVAPVVVVVVAIGLAGCSSAGNGGTAGAGGSGTYTAAEVAKASGANKVTPIFAVPKTLPSKYTFGFLNPGKSLAFFATWSQGMNDAAKFYGVNLAEGDLGLKYDTELSVYQQISVKQPTVVGSNPMNQAAFDAIKKDKAKVLLIDNTFKGAQNFGVSDAQVGELAVTTLEPQAKEKIAGDWAGKTVDIVGLTAANCSACDARVQASLAKAQTDLNIAEGNQFVLTPPGTDPTSSAQTTAADFLTAHPKDAVLFVSYGDEPVVGAVNAAKAADRGADVIGVTNGGDAVARAALRDKSNAGILVASIDYQPYQEGWNWIEAAIAVQMGKSFSPYKVTRVLTADNVDQYYPDDKK